VKDMARLGRNLKDSIIIDNSPLSFAFQPENGMPILSWYDDRTDTKLIELIPVL
jgi:carboxy-terminal domain RNA polymerase II polypeptide A small phosphatase